MMKRCPVNRSLLVGSLCVVVGSTALAAPSAEEGFLTGAEGYVPGALVGQSVEATGYAGEWLKAWPGANSPDFIGTGLEYSDGTESMATGGGAIEYRADGRVGRILSQTYGDTTTGSVYVGVMMKVNGVFSDYRGFELHQGGFDDGANRRLQIVTGEPGIGATDSAYVLRIKDGDSFFPLDLGESDTGVNFFVLRIDFSTEAGGDSVTIWRNPEDLKNEANSTEAGTLTGFDFAFDRTSFARFGGADSLQFDEIRVGASWGDVTTVVDPSDTDGDGILDSYETANGLTVGVDDSSGDLDMDDSSNLEEFLRNTRANVADTDGDGVKDGWEDGGGVFVNAMQTGTDPLLFDTDGDGLRDGYEDGSGSLTDATETGTDPNKADSDGDGEDDAVEVREGTDPNSGADSSAARGLIILDGRKDDLYPEAVAVQTIETGFGDNQSEWNAAYAYVSDGFLHLLLTGNLEANFNKLEIFIDSEAGGQTTFEGVAGNDGSDAMNTMIFDTGFEPDYHLIARRGSGKFDLNIADLQAGTFDEYFEVLQKDGSSVVEGIGETGTGSVNATAIRVGYDNSNTAGIGGAAGNAADQAAALAVTTGLELRIALSDLGNPGGEIRIMALQNNGAHDFLANQSLAGLPEGTGNLAGPGRLDFRNYPGDQFFPVTVGPGEDLQITQVTPRPGESEIEILIEGMVTGQTYHLQSSPDLKSWSPIPGRSFRAPGRELIIILGMDHEANRSEFIRIVEGSGAGE